MDKVTFGTRLKELREAAGLSRQELADKAGLKIGGIRDIEQGRRMPMFDTAQALAVALGVDCTAFTEPPSGPYTPRPGRPAKTKPEPGEEKPKKRGRPKKGGGQ